VSLDEYRRKRRPGKTPEPFTSAERSSALPTFVVQRHDARRLHYDFRLEREGALASWAVPKGVPLEPGARALAVHVEDHPLEYGSFEGEIPAGQYGAGTVEIWDDGTYELLEEKRNGQLTFELHGRRLHGRWTLVPAHLDGKEENWLLIKGHDEDEDEVVQGSYRPMLASVDTGVPHGDGWTFEVKFDGYRALAYLRGGECRLVSRNDNDLTGRFPELARALVKAVRSPNAVVDGEVCRIDPSGRTSFSELQQGTGPLVYYAFDLLELDGEPLVELPLRERKERLRTLLDGRVKNVAFSEGFDDGDTLFDVAKEQHFEGVIAKRLDSTYKVGRRTRDWLKIKTENTDEFVVVGYTRGAGRRAGTFGSLVLAVNEGDELRYVGNVGTGFDDAEIRRLLQLLKPLHRETSPFVVVPKMPRVRKGDVQWVEPRLVAQVRYGEWTHDGHLRHPAYQGIREDKEAAEVTAPQPIEDVIRKGKRELRLSNLDKPFWPEEGITKGDLLRYYRTVAPVLLPHLKDRPFTMRRYPDGAYGQAFFQKDAPKHMPDWIPTFHALVSARDSARTKKWIDFPLVNDELALLWMVNMGCIDMNAWYSRVDRPDRPDFVLFDLDPPEEHGAFELCVRVAHLVRGALEELGLESFVKTSGADGIHVLVPIARRHGFDDTYAFAELLSRRLEQEHPGEVTTEWLKRKRSGVLVDHRQNGHGKTIASVYSVRPKPGAPVSTPLAWDELTEDVRPRDFGMQTALARVQRHGDLFAPVLAGGQSLGPALRRLRETAE
jgi:bifunctional non-homologous end joining protein LigD